MRCFEHQPCGMLRHVLEMKISFLEWINFMTCWTVHIDRSLLKPPLARRNMWILVSCMHELPRDRWNLPLGSCGKNGPRKTKEAMKLYETYILILITNALATFFGRICRCRCGVGETLMDSCAREASNLNLQRYASPGWFVGMFLGFPGSNGTLLEDARMRIYYNHNSIVIPYTCNISDWL